MPTTGNNIEPVAPFGFGLGYTSFELGQPSVVDEADLVARKAGRVSWCPSATWGTGLVNVLVQAYLGAVDDEPHRPLRTLAGFAVVRPGPGETAEAVIDIPAVPFAQWDSAAQTWTNQVRNGSSTSACRAETSPIG